MLTNFNDFRDLCHTTSVACGWWKNAQRYADTIRSAFFHQYTDPDRLNIPTKIALVHTEIREAYDYYLSGENDDHLPHLLGAAVELGDVTIRVADTAGYLQIDMDAAIAEVSGEFYWNDNAGCIEWEKNGDGLFETWIGIDAITQLHNFAADATEAFRRGKLNNLVRSLARIVVLADLICERNSWDLLPISREKVAYNVTRADHKAEARVAEGGKKF